MVKNNLSGFYKNIHTSSNRQIFHKLFNTHLFLNDKNNIALYIIHHDTMGELEKKIFIYNRQEWASDLLQNQIIHNHRPISKESLKKTNIEKFP